MHVDKRTKSSWSRKYLEIYNYWETTTMYQNNKNNFSVYLQTYFGKRDDDRIACDITRGPFYVPGLTGIGRNMCILFCGMW